jgi:hypothetical protein
MVSMRWINLRVGSKIFVLGALGLKNFGVYVGKRGLNGEDLVRNAEDGKVVMDFLWNFRQCTQVYFEGVAMPGHGEFVVSHALSLVGKEYDLLFFNCKHFATVAYEEVPNSRQIQKGVGLVAIKAEQGLIG